MTNYCQSSTLKRLTCFDSCHMNFHYAQLLSCEVARVAIFQPIFNSEIVTFFLLLNAVVFQLMETKEAGADEECERHWQPEPDLIFIGMLKP